jgi:hypothetical protein
LLSDFHERGLGVHDLPSQPSECPIDLGIVLGPQLGQQVESQAVPGGRPFLVAAVGLVVLTPVSQVSGDFHPGHLQEGAHEGGRSQGALFGHTPQAGQARPPQQMM